MSVSPSTFDITTATLIDDLQEIVAALDRRVPRLERAGEIEIARDAAHLRDEAIERLRKLEGR